MLVEETFSPSETVLSNIASLAGEQAVLGERRICEIAELADEAVRFSLRLYEIGVDAFDGLSMIGESLADFSQEMEKDDVALNRDRLKYLLCSLSLMDKAHFAEIFAELLTEKNKPLFESDFLPELSAEETFVYVKNVFADEAYDVFSQDFSDPRVRYAENFREAVRMVADGEVSYCILPLEEGGARLSTIAELLYRAELKINSVIPVFGMDADADVKYALVSRHFTVPDKNEDDDRYLEIRIPTDCALALPELLFAAESYGVRVYRVNTLNFKINDRQRGYYSIVFSGEDVDFTTLLVFLTLFASEYTAVGIYKNLEL